MSSAVTRRDFVTAALVAGAASPVQPMHCRALTQSTLTHQQLPVSNGVTGIRKCATAGSAERVS